MHLIQDQQPSIGRPNRRSGGLRLGALFRIAWPRRPLPEHPQLVWSGDGGSVGLGHVNLSHRIVDLMRERNVDKAIDTFLIEQKMQAPHRLFRAPVAGQLRRPEAVPGLAVGLHRGWGVVGALLGVHGAAPEEAPAQV